jgi:hypothetical protein
LLFRSGCSVEVWEPEAATLLSVCQELKNDELCSLLFEHILWVSPLSVDNMCKRFHQKGCLSDDFAEGLRFVSSHFSAIESEAMA